MKIFSMKCKKALIVVTCFFCLQNVSAQNWDVNLAKSINPDNPNSALMKGFTKSVYPISLASPVALLATGYIEKNKQLRVKGWEAVGTLAINTMATQGLKWIVNRERPYEKYPGIIHPYQLEGDASFPSGHTSTAFATATTLSIEFKKWYVIIPAYVWAAGVGYSRLYLGEHYTSDVVGGAVVGAGSAALSHWLTKKFFK